MEGVWEYFGNYFFEVASLSIAFGALVYAVLAFHVAKTATKAAEASDLVSFNLKAGEVMARAEQSFLSLQKACHDLRLQWENHHRHHTPNLGAYESRQEDTRHIIEVEVEGRKLLMMLKHEMDSLSVDTLKDFIQNANQTTTKIERLALQLTPPKQLFA
ncbi:hypothetical protein [Maritalea porphyrae]|uniref:DUF2730 family protein n=1 Tax=Maritalea porphyrae TaxID=880732 RepID=A0ABQ5UQ11_9HYPH|nr:hypothetical protein [Maritalea porphyrae]GLQ16446.1 hypothetical protein GCM10007879_06950 [Maritalea porphyrae]